MPTIASNAKWSRVFAGGLLRRHGVESDHLRVGLNPRSQESRPGIPIPPLTPSEVHRPPMYSVTCVGSPARTPSRRT